jgi:hypothetical protein
MFVHEFCYDRIRRMHKHYNSEVVLLMITQGKQIHWILHRYMHHMGTVFFSEIHSPWITKDQVIATAVSPPSPNHYRTRHASTGRVEVLWLYIHIHNARMAAAGGVNTGHRVYKGFMAAWTSLWSHA